VIIHDFNIVDPISFPPKTYSPLIVYADTVLRFTITLERLKVVTGRNAQCRQFSDSVKLKQLPSRYPLNISKASDQLAVE
jgi:hypothetical protein